MPIVKLVIGTYMIVTVIRKYLIKEKSITKESG